MAMDTLDDLEVLRLAEEVADEIWDFVSDWNGFERRTIGSQIVRAIDSVGANIAEAYGRYHYGEKLQFLYYARGSLFEAKYWINRSVKRGLMPSDVAQQLAQKLSDTAKQINAFARYIKSKQFAAHNKTNKLRETQVEYAVSAVDDPPVFAESDLSYLSSIPNHQ